GSLAVAAPGRSPVRRAPRRTGGRPGGSTVTGNSLASPMQGTIVKTAVADGDVVAEGDLVVVLEAMKMEQPLNAHRAGTIKGLTASVGDVVASGAVICEITD
ncbi:MAG TPA: biotin/lipoyl-containing protein, partial [Mycobacteriales bacterium]